MLKSLLIGVPLAALAAGCASAPPPHALTDTGARFTHELCLPATGTRIAVREHECAAFGRSYTGEEIRNTGASTVDEALRLLDPSITVHR
ncbi:MAG: hypothetical protein E6K49_01400 [Gammaproteobacteria bacterium]|nr:MAG: hypothetical protein E6K49_01400 [Gammaproteobacteria bacterium]